MKQKPSGIELFIVNCSVFTFDLWLKIQITIELTISTQIDMNDLMVEMRKTIQKLKNEYIEQRTESKDYDLVEIFCDKLFEKYKG